MQQQTLDVIKNIIIELTKIVKDNEPKKEIVTIKFNDKDINVLVDVPMKDIRINVSSSGIDHELMEAFFQKKRMFEDQFKDITMIRMRQILKDLSKYVTENGYADYTEYLEGQYRLFIHKHFDTIDDLCQECYEITSYDELVSELSFIDDKALVDKLLTQVKTHASLCAIVDPTSIIASLKNDLEYSLMPEIAKQCLDSLKL